MSSYWNLFTEVRYLKICVDLHNLGPPSAALAPFVPGFFSKAIVFVSSSLPVILSHSVCASVCETLCNVAIMWEPKLGFAACTCRRPPSVRPLAHTPSSLISVGFTSFFPLLPFHPISSAVPATSQASSQGLICWLLNSKTLHLWGVIMRWAGSEGWQKSFQNSCLRLRTSQYDCVALSGPIWAMLMGCLSK